MKIFGLFCRLRTDAAEVIDDVPDLVLGHLRGKAFHGRFRNAVADHREDFAVARPMFPLGVDEIGGRWVQLLGRRAVSRTGSSVTAGATPVVQARTIGDRLGSRWNRILRFGGGFRMLMRSLVVLPCGDLWNQGQIDDDQGSGKSHEVECKPGGA